MKNKILIPCSLILTLGSFWSGVTFADKLSNKTLDLLSAEAGETDMQETAPTTPDSAPVEADMDESKSPTDDSRSEDELSDSITSQLSEILAAEGNDSETEEKLEKMVSTALINGANMNELRSAVSAAMDDIKSSPEKTSEPVEQPSKPFNKLVGKISRAELIKNLDLEEKGLKILLTTQSTTSSSKKTPRSLAKTVTVLDGESLYKVALRVYGRGEDYLRLYNANKSILTDPNKIQTGQILKVPDR